MGSGTANKCPDATQPRVTVRPKPPVLLGATSTMTRWHRAGVVSDNPCPGRTRQLQGSHRDAPRTISDRTLVPTPVPPPLRGSLPALDPALQRSLGFPPVRLAAFLRASLAPTLRCSLEVRWAPVSELKTGCASRQVKVNGDSRNPDVLPTFLRVIPKGSGNHPQFFPMVTRSEPSGRCRGRRRRRCGGDRAPIRSKSMSAVRMVFMTASVADDVPLGRLVVEVRRHLDPGHGTMIRLLTIRRPNYIVRPLTTVE